MPRRVVALTTVFVCGALFNFSFAAGMSGEYFAPDEGVALTIQESSQGDVSGRMFGDGDTAEVVGRVVGSAIVGTVYESDGEAYRFEAQLSAGRLNFVFKDGDFLSFQSGSEQGTFDSKQLTSEQTQNGQLSINGVGLNPTQISQLAMYGIRAQPGHYWYDSSSGAWGPWGQPTAGFVQSGISVSPLPSNASNGTTGIFINGRVITTSEAIYLQSLAGSTIQPGDYWLDAQGNAGQIGGPAQINFFQRTQQQAQQGASWRSPGSPGRPASSGWQGADGSGGIWIANPNGGTGTTITY